MHRPTRDKFSAWFRRLVPSRLARRFVRQQDGSAAVEFGLVAVPFLGLTFAILETALVFFAGQTLETAVTDSARLIMTGQAQDKAWTKDDFKTEVCSRIHGLFDCVGGVYVDVKTYENFAAINNDLPLTDGKIDEFEAEFQPRHARPDRGRYALLSVADLRLAARKQSYQHKRQQAPAGRDGGLLQRAVLNRNTLKFLPLGNPP